jgi:hypothetical protein
VDLIAPFLQGLYNFFLTALVTGVQIICWPINEIINAAFPALSGYITTAVTNLANNLSWLSWVLSFLPPGTVTLLLFILGVELVFLYVFQSSYYVAKIWTIVQKIKFW